MNPGLLSIARSSSDLKAEAAFKSWVRRFVKGAAALQAFEAGEVDAVVDQESGCTILLPDAQASPQGSSRLALSALDALPGAVCVLDSAGLVLNTNRAWRRFVAAHSGAGLSVCEGENFFAACRNARASERVYAAAVATGLRQILDRVREQFRCKYVSDSAGGHCAFTLHIVAVVSGDVMHAVITRDNVSEHKRTSTSRAIGRVRSSRQFTVLARAAASNLVLAALPVKEFESLLAELEPVRLDYGQVLYEPHDEMQYVHFPTDSIVSLLTVVDGRRALEVGLIGREGMLGSRIALGNTSSAVRALVQGTGRAMRIKSQRFLNAFRHCPGLRSVVLRFIDSLMVQISQTAACNQFHGVEARLARWLLMTRERSPFNEFYLTQDLLADMLGVRREAVTHAASALRSRKLIHYHRGTIVILDQQSLEAAACACYGHVNTAELRSTR